MSTSLQYTPLDEIAKTHARLRATFDSGKTLPLAYRRQQLLQLARLVQQNAPAFESALWREFRKQPLEIAMVDLSPVVSAALYAAENLEWWTGAEEAKEDAGMEENAGIVDALTQKLRTEQRTKEEQAVLREEQTVPKEEKTNLHQSKCWHTTVQKQPKGLVVNISPWNYPIILSLSPLVGAIAAGCVAILKPSEHTPIVSAMFAELFPKYLDPDAYAVVNGGVEETGRLLEMKFDHIFFTGSTHVGRIVAAAAAKQLTTMTLELGGKSPVFVDAAHTDLDIAARRILWGRQVCAGQVCVSPDYVLVPRAYQDAFVAAVRRAYEEFWPKGDSGVKQVMQAKQAGADACDARDGSRTARDGSCTAGDGVSSTLSGVHPTARNRISALVRETKGAVVEGDVAAGAHDAPTAPTVLRDVGLGDALMRGEIFGPILPIVPIDGDDDTCAATSDDTCTDEAIKIINSHPAPLVIYVFTEREGVRERFLNATRSGTLVLNDCVQQLAVYEMPFGGVGDSGSGSWFGKATFDTFTDVRRVVSGRV